MKFCLKSQPKCMCSPEGSKLSVGIVNNRAGLVFRYRGLRERRTRVAKQVFGHSNCWGVIKYFMASNMLVLACYIYL